MRTGAAISSWAIPAPARVRLRVSGSIALAYASSATTASFCARATARSGCTARRGMATQASLRRSALRFPASTCWRAENAMSGFRFRRASPPPNYSAGLLLRTIRAKASASLSNFWIASSRKFHVPFSNLFPMNPRWRPSVVSNRKTIEKRSSAQFAALCEALLDRGAKVRFRAQGQSMQPNILNDDAVVVVPAGAQDLRRGNVALTRSEDGFHVHRVLAARPADGVITRGDSAQENDRAANLVLGKVVAIERHGRMHSMALPGQKYVHACRSFFYRFGQAAALRAAKLASASALFALLILGGTLLTASPAAGQAFTISNNPAPTPVAPGGTITYTQVISNTSGNNITATIAVSQTIPANATFGSINVAGHHAGTFTCLPVAPAPGATLTCTDTSGTNYGSGAADNTTFTLILNVPAATTDLTVITDKVSVSSGNAPTVSSTANVTVQTPKVSVTNSGAPNPADVASNITYTQTVTNSSTTTPAFNLTFSENTPANTTFQSLPTPTGWTCPTEPGVGGTGTISCSATTLAANTSSTFTLAVQVNYTVSSRSE